MLTHRRAMTGEIVKMLIVSVFLLLLVIIFGRYMFFNAQSSRDRAYISFINDLSLQSRGVAGSNGKIEQKTYSLDRLADKVYIFDKNISLNKLSYKENEVIESNLQEGTSDNIFFFKDNKLVYSGTVSYLDMDSPHYACIDVIADTTRLRFKGNSLGASISPSEEDTDCSYAVLIREIVTEKYGDLDSEEFREKLEIFKEISKSIDPGIKVDYYMQYDPEQDKTTLKLLLSSDNAINDFLYFIALPKCLLEAADPDAFVHTLSDVNTEVIREDPIVMWDFGRVDSTGIETELVSNGKISEVCKELLSHFAYTRSNPLGTGVVVGRQSEFEDYDKDGIPNGEDDYPDDLDNDAFPDRWESYYHFAEDDANVPGHENDYDDDGATNKIEFNYAIDPLNNDTDGDRVIDGTEIYIYHTLANNSDSDSDGMDDGYEVKFDLDPLSDDSDEDSDSDGLSNSDEYKIGTDPKDSDSDKDGIDDGEEVEKDLDPLDTDTDDDNVLDGYDDFPLNSDYFIADETGLPADSSGDCKGLSKESCIANPDCYMGWTINYFMGTYFDFLLLSPPAICMEKTYSKCLSPRNILYKDECCSSTFELNENMFCPPECDTDQHTCRYCSIDNCEGCLSQASCDSSGCFWETGTGVCKDSSEQLTPKSCYSYAQAQDWQGCIGDEDCFLAYDVTYTRYSCYQIYETPFDPCSSSRYAEDERDECCQKTYDLNEETYCPSNTCSRHNDDCGYCAPKGFCDRCSTRAGCPQGCRWDEVLGCVEPSTP